MSECRQNLEGAQQHFLRKGALCEDNLNLYLNFAKGTTAKAQGTMAIAVGVVGHFEACCRSTCVQFCTYAKSNYA